MKIKKFTLSVLGGLIIFGSIGTILINFNKDTSSSQLSQENDDIKTGEEYINTTSTNYDAVNISWDFSNHENFDSIDQGSILYIENLTTGETISIIGLDVRSGSLEIANLNQNSIYDFKYQLFINSSIELSIYEQSVTTLKAFDFTVNTSNILEKSVDVLWTYQIVDNDVSINNISIIGTGVDVTTNYEDEYIQINDLTPATIYGDWIFVVNYDDSLNYSYQMESFETLLDQPPSINNTNSVVSGNSVTISFELDYNGSDIITVILITPNYGDGAINLPSFNEGFNTITINDLPVGEYNDWSIDVFYINSGGVNSSIEELVPSFSII